MSEAQRRSIVDTTIVTVLNDPDETASRRDNVSMDLERLYRIQGASAILSVAAILELKIPITCTACTLFHRFYHQASLKKHDVWATAIAALLLASKVEEEPVNLQNIIAVFVHVYRKRRLICIEDDVAGSILDRCQHIVKAGDIAPRVKLDEKETLLRQVKPLSPVGPIYQEWYKKMLELENLILRQLGFTLYWIPSSHPHRFAMCFLKTLQPYLIGDNNKELTQRTWNYCNDSYRVDLCVRFMPEVIACAALQLATQDLTVQVKQLPKPFITALVGEGQKKNVVTVCETLRGLQDRKHLELLAARVAYMPSLIHNGSFCDPESYLWSKED